MASKSTTRRQKRTLPHAKARLELTRARAYIDDLRRWQTGDDARFTRMVNGRGQQLGDPAQWVEYVRRILARGDVWHYQPGVCRRFAQEMQRLGYSVSPAAADD